MKIGVNEGRSLNDLDGLVAAAKRAEADGFATLWIPQTWYTDVLTALAVVGREVPRIELGTAVVPTYPRHPQMLAAQALTVQAASGNRLALGIGLSHKMVVEGAWGFSYRRPVKHMSEYLQALVPLLHGEPSNVHGEQVVSVGGVSVAGAEAPPVLLAALGPRMLELAGGVGDGTITWCTGAKTIANHIAPSINSAAEAAGRALPRIVAGLPVCVTDEPDAARDRIRTVLAGYEALPSYRAMLDREGVDGPADIAAVGSEDEVGEVLVSFEQAGVTDLNAAVLPRSREEGERTTAFLRTLVS